MSIYQENTKFILKNKINKAISTYYSEEPIKRNINTYDINIPKISIINCDSFNPDIIKEDTLVLNFASATTPGGGYVVGSIAQEECLCNQSDLYEELIKNKQFYMNKDNKYDSFYLYTDRAIYSKGITIFRDVRNKFLENMYNCDVITMAAPNNNINFDEMVLQNTFENRINKLFAIAELNKNRRLVLGAWGCGVFKNDPYKVATYFKNIILNGSKIDEIIFAIYEPGKSCNNYNAFKNVFADMENV